MILKILADPRQVPHHANPMLRKVLLMADTGKLEQLRTADPARRQDAFLTDTRLIAMPRLVTVGGARRGPVFEQKMIEARLGADGEQRVAAPRLGGGREGAGWAKRVSVRVELVGPGTL